MSIESLRALMTASRNRDAARITLVDAFAMNASTPERRAALLDAYDAACREFLLAANNYNLIADAPPLHYRHT